MTLGGIVWLTIGSAVLFLGVKFLSQRDKEKKERLKSDYYQKKTQWDAAIQKYNRSYFCFRDGIIYDPETGDIGKLDSLMEFLYTTRE